MPELRVQAPPDEVFAVIVDPAHWDTWMSIHAGWPDGAPAHLDEGARFRQEAGLLGVRDTVTVTVTEHRAPAVLAMYAEGNHGANLDLSFHVEPDGTGSVVRVEPRIVGNLVRPLRILAARGLDAPMRQSLRQLEQHINQRAATAASA